MVILTETGTLKEADVAGFRFQFWSQEKKDVMAPFRKGVEMELSFKEPSDDVSKFLIKEEYKRLLANGFNWNNLGKEVKVSAALVAYKKMDKSAGDFQRIVTPVATDKFKVGK
jgi:hypothetical protein